MASNADCSEQAIALHNKMVDKIGEMIVYASDCWDRILGILNNSPLTRRDQKSIKSIQELFEKLMEKLYIRYGHYEELIEKLRNGVHPLAARIIEDYGKKIQKLIEEEKPKSKKRRRLTDEDESEQTSQEERIKRKRGESSNSSRTVTERQKRKLHADMVTKLSEALSSSMGSKWDLFKNNMKYHMNIGDAKLADITNMFTACEEMRAKGKIEIGKRYDELIAVVEDVDLNLVDIINEHLEKMGIEPTLRRTRRRTVSIDSS